MSISLFWHRVVQMVCSYLLKSELKYMRLTKEQIKWFLHNRPAYHKVLTPALHGSGHVASGAQLGRPEIVLTGGSLHLTCSLHILAQVVTVGLYDLLSPFSSGVVSQIGFLMCSGNCSNLVFVTSMATPSGKFR